jgi:hypothetical protein
MNLDKYTQKSQEALLAAQRLAQRIINGDVPEGLKNKRIAGLSTRVEP